MVIIGERTILRKLGRKNGKSQERPRSRTLTAVHERILEDIVYPAQVCDFRTRVRLDGKFYRATLDAKEKNEVGYKTDTFTRVYASLTGKNVSFDFSDPEEA